MFHIIVPLKSDVIKLVEEGAVMLGQITQYNLMVLRCGTRVWIGVTSEPQGKSSEKYLPFKFQIIIITPFILGLLPWLSMTTGGNENNIFSIMQMKQAVTGLWANTMGITLPWNIKIICDIEKKSINAIIGYWSFENCSDQAMCTQLLVGYITFLTPLWLSEDSM